MSKLLDRYRKLSDAIDAERKAEEAHYRSLSAEKTKAERIESGILWYPVVLLSQVYTVGEQVELVFERTKNLDSPHKLKSGAGCTVFKADGNSNLIELRGVVSYTRRNKVAIILSEEVVSKSQISDLKGHIGVELIYDDRPYKVMQSALKAVMSTDLPHIKILRDGISDGSSFEGTKPSNFEISPPHLNETQVKALNGSIRSENISIIHGPPGTGKTTTLVSVIKGLLNSEKRVLVCAPSNNAVDLLAQQLDMVGISVLRIGNVTRIADGLVHLTLAEKARMHADWQHIKKVKIEAVNASKKAGKYKRSFGERERAERRDMYKEARELKNWAKDLEYKLVSTLVSEAQVICSTLIGVSHKSIRDLNFKTLVIDEASQALEPECWNAMLKAEKVILAGDHLQLAPTVKSSDAVEMGLADTLLTQLTDKIRHTYLLGVQYRMHEQILSFSNKEFYSNKLISHESVAERTLENDEEPLVFIDTSGCGFDETINKRTLSKFNEGEFFILREHFLQSADRYKDASIGIISPYSEQVKYLKLKLEEDEELKKYDIVINSIDGFQGQEKDVIYISLVRSNDKGEIGFLSDEKRLNVAMTRARKKLILIGDMSTLSKSKLFNRLSEHVEKVGVYQSAWEYMSM